MFVKYSTNLLVILSVVLFLSTSALAEPSWFWQHPKPTGSWVYDIQFIDNNNGWIVTSLGEIFGTDDSGVSWEELYRGEESLKGVCFINDSEGWACGEDGIVLHTSDGGQNWNSSHPTSQELLSIEFIDENYGTITGYGGLLMRSMNGGDSWQQQGTTGFGGILDASFVNITTGWAAVSQGSVLYTETAGAFWEEQNTGVSSVDMFTGIHFINELIGFTVGEGYIISTSNGGDDWIVSHEESGADFSDVDFFQNLGVVSGKSGAAVTEDAGSMWMYDTMPATFELPGSLNLEAVSVPSDSRAFTSGGYGLIYSRDASDVWNQLSSHQAVELLHSITHSDENHIWSCGDDGLIMSSTNGGENWDSQILDEDFNFEDICFPTSLVGYCVGSSPGGGVVMKTLNGGVSWSEISPSSPPAEYLISVDFMNENSGVAVGAQGEIIYTTDGGENWTTKSGLTSSALYNVQFSNTDRGWIVGSAGTILCFDFNSDSWSEQVSDMSNTFFGLFALNAETAWAVGLNGTIVRTTDTGNFWETLEVTGNNYFSVWFDSNGLDGYFAGTLFGETSDGGYTITHSPENSRENNMRCLSMLDNDNGWGCGVNGAILRFGEDLLSIEEFNTSVTPATEMNMLTSPNPFTYSSMVSFTLPGERFVSIDLYDISGRKIQSVQSSSLSGGEHDMMINGVDLAPGLYFLRLSAGDISETRTMVRVP